MPPHTRPQPASNAPCTLRTILQPQQRLSNQLGIHPWVAQTKSDARAWPGMLMAAVSSPAQHSDLYPVLLQWTEGARGNLNILNAQAWTDTCGCKLLPYLAR